MAPLGGKKKGSKSESDTATQPVFELYDVIADPSESKNVASQHPEIVARLKKELTDWQTSCKKSDEGGDY